MESNIPQEVKGKIAIKFMSVEPDLVFSSKRIGLSEAAYYGYHLALPEISALKAEVERLKLMLHTTGNNLNNIQTT